jgi:hypothetical protein
MNKVYYKNEEFFYEIDKSPNYRTHSSFVWIYRKREGFWKIFSPYKLILKKEFGKDNFSTNEEILKHHLKDIKEGHPPVFIDCSKQLEEVLKL